MCCKEPYCSSPVTCVVYSDTVNVYSHRMTSLNFKFFDTLQLVNAEIYCHVIE
jgi:hypothetical protein